LANINLDLKLQPKQEDALYSPATEILFGGASGGGKSHLVRVALIVACVAIKGMQATLIRKKYSDIWDNHVEGTTGFKAMLEPLIKTGLVVITREEIRFMFNGSRINFVHLQDERQFDTAQGIERQFLVVDEATQISEKMIRTFRTWVRAGQEFKANLPPEFKGMFPRILYTANPVGLSLPFFRKHFVKSRPAYDIAEVEGFKRQFIPSSLYDNEAVDPEEAKARIEGLGDPKLSAALITGDWDSPLGDFYSNYSDERLTIEDFEIPEHWYRFRAFDWGSAEPFFCTWVAVVDGDSHDLPVGCMVIYREWNGCDPNDNAKGLHYKNEDIAQGIVRRSPDCPLDTVTLTDSFPFRELGGPSISSIFAAQGVPLRQADTSRVLGWKLLRDRMEGNKRGESMIRVFESCEYIRYYWPMLQRHKTKAEDAVEDGEATHSMDTLRYAVATYPKIVHKIEKPKPITIGTERPTFNDVIERHARMKNAGKDW
jgi:hypothetical protein